MDFPIVQLLRANSFDVLYIMESHSGIDDDEVLTISNNENAILITQDKDFGELVYRLKRAHSGIVLVRLEGKKPAEKAKIVLSVIEKYKTKLQNSFSIIHEDFVKIRT